MAGQDGQDGIGRSNILVYLFVVDRASNDHQIPSIASILGIVLWRLEPH